MLKRIKELRETYGFSQKALAEAIGVSQQSINKYENHNIEPDIETLTRLAVIFNTSIDYLVGFSDINHKVENMCSYDLNDEEASLILHFRKLNNKQKACIHCIMDSYQEIAALPPDRSDKKPQKNDQ